jgi:hypothetical protein
MSAFTFNIAKGRTTEFHKRVNDNDPGTSTLKIVVLADHASLESDATLQDYDTLAAILAPAGNNEPTNTNYARKSLTDSDLSAETVDDTLNRIVLPFPTQTWTSVGAGDSWRKLLVCYDAASGADSAIIPVTCHDLLISGAAIIPTGANVVISGTNGWMIAR